MPPKAKSAERLQQEAAAQRARAAALQHLAKTGAGPSQKEIAQQQKEREKWTNATTQAVQKRLALAQPAQATPGAPVRDNTLAVVAAQRARMMLQGGAAVGSAVDTGASGGYGTSVTAQASFAGGESEALPDGWKPAVDPTSGETYYWNETTKETSWERPKLPSNVVDDKTGSNDDDDEEPLEEGWEEVTDPQSGQMYYWHRDSNETTWTRPVKKTVSLEQAREAKSRLDAILKLCGPSKKPAVQQTTKPQAQSDTSGSSSSKKRDVTETAENTALAKKARVSS